MKKEEFIELIKKDYPLDFKSIISNLSLNRYNSLRINTLKTNQNEIEKILIDNSIKYEISDKIENAIIIFNVSKIKELDIYKEGKIYLQSLSSQVPPLIMDLENKFDILDMCAAPGGKTCEIACLTNDSKNIMACESNKIRFNRLKYNVNKQGVNNISLKLIDASKLDSFFRFDSILLDAPCSGSGTISFIDDKTLSKFSYNLISNSSKIQKKLLKKAIEILKPGHTLVYSTCSILKEENEEVLKTVLNSNVILDHIDFNIESKYLLPSSLDNCLTIKPSEYYEGFFISKLKKLK